MPEAVVKVGSSAPLISIVNVLSAIFVPSDTLTTNLKTLLVATSNGTPCITPSEVSSRPGGSDPAISE